MIWKNKTISEFYLLGFNVLPPFQIVIFMVFILIYSLTVIGNVIIILLVWTQPHLKTPMYFFLGNLSFMEIWYVSVTIPKLLADLITEKRRISITACIAQCYIFFVLGAIENYFLAVMAYDRYLAICNPLRYSSIMNHTYCCKLVFGCWLISLFDSAFPLYFVCKLTFCGTNEINHFFCDILPLLTLSCTDTIVLRNYFFVVMCIVVFGSLCFIITTYLHIVLTISKIPSISGKSKAFSTCVSHLTIVVMYYSSVILIYVRSPDGHTVNYDKTVALLFAVITPLFNPIIYSLRNKEVKDTLKLYFKTYCISLKNTN